MKHEPVHFLDIARGGKGPICGSNLPWQRYDLLTIRADLVTCPACLDRVTKYLARARNAETLAAGDRTGEADPSQNDSGKPEPKDGDD